MAATRNDLDKSVTVENPSFRRIGWPPFQGNHDEQTDDDLRGGCEEVREVRVARTRAAVVVGFGECLTETNDGKNEGAQAQEPPRPRR
jgi:hypothetical protein